MSKHRRSISLRPEKYARLVLLAEHTGVSIAAATEDAIDRACELHSIPEQDRQEAIAKYETERKLKSEPAAASGIWSF